jgi:malate synthase
MNSRITENVRFNIDITPQVKEILTNDALAFLTKLHRNFNEKRKFLLKERQEKQKGIDEGKFPTFLSSTQNIRKDSSWQAASPPRDLLKRYVEITGPVERKMMINAFNSGANIFMADFEDSLSPTWQNIIEGQRNLLDATLKKLSFTSPEGKHYTLNPNPAVLMVRPRGWHLHEKHISIDEEVISASLFDFAIFFFHNAKISISNGSGPYFYLPKLQSHLEAKLWNDVFCFAQDELNIPRGTIRATVLIETIWAAFEMEEILYELREHSAGLNAGRWDYIFSIIKTFSNHQEVLFPDRNQISMTVPFMQSYTNLLIQTCHKRGAHAMGGMAAFIPSRKDKKVSEEALKKVWEDKQRESSEGFDGTWVAHPDLVSLINEIFVNALQGKPHQKERVLKDIHISEKNLLNFKISGGKITEQGFRHNIDVSIQYLESWLRGVGAVGLYNLMEDAATAEISRAQIWEWLHRSNAVLETGSKITLDYYHKVIQEEMQKLKTIYGEKEFSIRKFKQAEQLFDKIVTQGNFIDFFTIEAYNELE